MVTWSPSSHEYLIRLHSHPAAGLDALCLIDPWRTLLLQGDEDSELPGS